MKVTNLKKKVGAALLAAGMITPAAAFAASGLGHNLIADPSFEDASVSSDPNNPTGPYQTLGLNSWSDGSQVGSTYRYGQNYDKPNNRGDVSGNNPAGQTGQDRYFTANFPNFNVPSGQDTTTRNEVSQNVTFSAGALDLIATGTAEYWIEGWFGGYGGSSSEGVFEVAFYGAGGAPIGLAIVQGSPTDDGDPNGPNPTSDWTRDMSSGLIPAGALTAIASVYKANDGGNGAAHIDTVRFMIHVPEPSTVLLAGLGIVGMGVGSLRKRKA